MKIFSGTLDDPGSREETVLLEEAIKCMYIPGDGAYTISKEKSIKIAYPIWVVIWLHTQEPFEKKIHIPYKINLNLSKTKELKKAKC